MFEAICPRCGEAVTGPNEAVAMREYSFHWLTKHDDVPPGSTVEPPEHEEE